MYQIEIRTNHKNLEYWKSPQKLTRRQARWVQILQNFWFALEYLPGTSNPPDTLSRMDDLEDGKNDNEDFVVLSPELFRNHHIPQGHILIDGKEKDILKNIRKAENYNKDITQLAKDLKTKGKKVV